LTSGKYTARFPPAPRFRLMGPSFTYTLRSVQTTLNFYISKLPSKAQVVGSNRGLKTKYSGKQFDRYGPDFYSGPSRTGTPDQTIMLTN
jgi:hypothetical protein